MYYIALIFGIIIVIYKIYDMFTHDAPIFECYVAGYLPLILFMIGGSIHPASRGYMALFHFYAYTVLAAILIFPVTMLPVIVAHIMYKVKNRGRIVHHDNATKKLRNLPIILFIVGLVLLFYPFPVGFLLSTGVCIHTIVRFIKRKRGAHI